MAETGAAAITPLPASGRVFTTSRDVCLGDISTDGTTRLDALARYLQDIAQDDSADAAYPNPMAWVVRRTLIEAESLPLFQERLTLSTWCSGFGGRWAERSTQIRGDRGSVVNAAAVWVHMDPNTGTPRPLSNTFHQVWSSSAAGRKISARLVLPSKPPAHRERLPWLIRVADLDVMNHMNNAAHWSALEEAVGHLDDPGSAHLKHSQPEPGIPAADSTDGATCRTSDGAATRRREAGPSHSPAMPPQINTPSLNSGIEEAAPLQFIRGEIEYIAPISAGQNPDLWAVRSSSGVTAWLTTEGATATAARLSRTTVNP